MIEFIVLKVDGNGLKGLEVKVVCEDRLIFVLDELFVEFKVLLEGVN